ncbi:MAG: hypothetical protein IPJ66_11540 [Bacteroidetes bacterium]|nr:hypothetical protein [Bacteroidota bacterium]
MTVSYELPVWKFKLEASVFNLDDYVFLSTSSRPEQVVSSIQVTQFMLSKNFKWRNFHLTTNFIFNRAQT